MAKEKHLARRIFINSLEYKLSIVEIDRDKDGNICSLDVRPFVGEEAGVTYHDVNLYFVKSSDGLWQFDER